MINRTYPVSVLAILIAVPALFAADTEPVWLVERFDPESGYRVDLRVDLSGELSVPGEDGKPPQTLAMSGHSVLQYDERVLPIDPTGDDVPSAKAVRVYRDVSFERRVGGQDQEANVRPAVRRMVVLRSAAGKKAPFSPDGPLTWNEIDVVRTDVFAPALVPGMLPTKAVRPGDTWALTTAAMTELTDLDPVKDGKLTVKFVSAVVLDGRRYAKLSLSGTVNGVATDGPSRHTLDGTGYFDLDAGRLSYLNLRGVHELLGPDGKAHGRVDGKFVLTRTPAGRVAELSDAALADSDLRPTAENTLLLYDNADLGVRFLYPRRWRVGAVRGRQLTIEDPAGGGILVTLEPAGSVPTAEQFLAETQEFLKSQEWAVSAVDPPRRWTDQVTRFALNADADDKPVRMEYAVLSQPDGGAVVAARLPWAIRHELGADVDRILKSLAVTKPIK